MGDIHENDAVAYRTESRITRVSSGAAGDHDCTDGSIAARADPGLLVPFFVMLPLTEDFQTRRPAVRRDLNFISHTSEFARTQASLPIARLERLIMAIATP